MRSAIVVLFTLLATVTGGCTEPSGGDETGSSGSGSGGPTSTGSATEPEPETSSDDGPGPTADTSSGDGAMTTEPTATTTGEDSTSDDNGTGPVCEPAPPAGDACLECVHANCCVAWQACMNDVPCACVVDCHVVQGNSLGMCSNSCNLDSNLYQALFFCGEASCLGSCDWDCC